MCFFSTIFISLDESSHFARNSIAVHENPVLVCLTQFWCVLCGKNISTMVWEYLGSTVFIFKFLFFFSEKRMDNLRDRPPTNKSPRREWFCASREVIFSPSRTESTKFFGIFTSEKILIFLTRRKQRKM